MPEKPTPLPRDGLQILIDWANEQDHWVRAIVSQVLAARRELGDKGIEAAYSLLLAEKGLSGDAAPNVPLLSKEVALVELADDLRIVRLAGVTGVNAIASGQEIAFNSKLTVLFGENAVGKTGYVRVLKRLASVRSAQAILGNVLATMPDGKPHATIDYSLSGVSKSLDWNDETGVPPFTRMSVFDSGVVTLHVDDDLTYVFTPGELALFLYVHRAIDAVKAHLDREKTAAQAKSANPFLPRFARDAVVYPKIETLGPSTSIPELEALAKVTPEEEASLATMRERVEALQPRSAESRLQVALADRDLYGSVSSAAKVAASFPFEAFNAAVEDVCKAEERYVAASRTAFAGEDISAICGDAWKDFIVAGEAYLRGVGMQEHPRGFEACGKDQQARGRRRHGDGGDAGRPRRERIRRDSELVRGCRGAGAAGRGHAAVSAECCGRSWSAHQYWQANRDLLSSDTINEIAAFARANGEVAALRLLREVEG